MSSAENAALVERRILDELSREFLPSYLEVENESHRHSVPANSATHFRVLIVSEKFRGLTRVARQRLVNDVLAAELNSGVHALAQRCLTADEWNAQTAEFKSPDCRGGSKIERKP